MTYINLTEFHGIMPRTHRNKLGDSYATVAHDVDLRHGTLRPWREPRNVQAASESTKTIYQLGCCWFQWDKCVEVSEYSQECQRLYVTGDQPYPVFTAVDRECNIGCGDKEWTRLGVPRPKNPPVVSGGLSAVTQESHETTSYIYTYVNCYCEEGPPSPVTSDIIRDDESGTPIVISGFETPSPEYNIKKIYIYRNVSGRMRTQEQVKEPVTEYFFVGEIDISTGVFNDTTRNLDIGHANNTKFYMEPPKGLRGISLANGGNTLAGFVQNKLYFSNNNFPHAWSVYNELSLDDNIRMIRPNGNKFTVMTDGGVYNVDAIGDCTHVNSCRAVSKSEYPFPAITCCSNFGSVSTPFGVIFVTARGLAMVGDSNPNPTLITLPWYAEDDWAKLRPETMRLGYHGGFLFCTSDTVTFMLLIDTTTYNNSHNKNYQLSTLSDKPTMYHLSRSGEMFLLEDGFIRQWGAGDVLRPFAWQSKVFDTREFANFLSLEIGSQAFTNFTLFADDKVVYNDIVQDQTDQRLPFYGRHKRHGLRFEGTDEVWGCSIATSFRELANIGD